MLIRESNKNKIEKMIKDAEGRAKVRTITYNDLLSAIEYVEKKLNICKKDMIGIKADIDLHAQNFPNAYRFRFTPESTHFYMERKASGWDLRNVQRCYTRRANHAFWLELPEHTKSAIIERMSDF